MCTHESTVESDYYTTICTDCGLEKQGPIYPSRSDVGSNAPLTLSFYSRYKRFQTHLDCVINPQHATFPKPITIARLLPFAPFASVGELLKTLKRIPHPKTYVHLHYYCVRFLKDYKPPALMNTFARYDLLSLFARVETEFKRKTPADTAFFSYPWLLTKLLTRFGCERFTPFIKNISCRKRAAKYEAMWQTLFSKT